MVQPQATGERGGLRHGTLVGLAVAHEAEGAAREAVEAVSEAATHRDGEAVAERAAADLDAGHAALGVTAEGAAVLAVLAQELLAIDGPAQRERAMSADPACALERMKVSSSSITPK